MSDVKPVNGWLRRPSVVEYIETRESEWCRFDEARDAITALQAEIEALRKDAERYRALIRVLYAKNVLEFGESAICLEVYGSCSEDDVLDAAVDAAIAKEKQQESLK